MTREEELRVIEALMGMVNQFFHSEEHRGAPAGTRTHSGMACEEEAV